MGGSMSTPIAGGQTSTGPVATPPGTVGQTSTGPVATSPVPGGQPSNSSINPVNGSVPPKKGGNYKHIKSKKKYKKIKRSKKNIK